MVLIPVALGLLLGTELWVALLGPESLRAMTVGAAGAWLAPGRLVTIGVTLIAATKVQALVSKDRTLMCCFPGVCVLAGSGHVGLGASERRVAKDIDEARCLDQNTSLQTRAKPELI